MKKAIWVASGLLTIIIALVVFYFKSIMVNGKSDSLFTFITDRNAFIISIKYENDLKELFSKNTNLPALVYNDFLNELNIIDELIQSSEVCMDAIENQDALIGIQKTSVNTAGCIYVSKINSKNIEEAGELFSSLTSGTTKAKSRNFENKKIWDVIFKGKSFYYSIIEGHLLLSVKSNLVEDAIRVHANGNSLQRNPIFTSWSESNRVKKPIASLFINYAALPEFNFLLFKTGVLNGLGFTSELAQFSNLQLNYKSDAWIFNGDIHTSEKNYLHVFKSQTANTSYLRKYLSSNIQAFQHFILSDMSAYRRDLIKYFKSNNNFSYEAEENLLKRKYDISIDNLISQHIGNEFIISYVSVRNNDAPKTLSMVLLQQASELSTYLNSFSKEKPGEIYKDFSIRTFPIKRFMFLLAGPAAKNIQTSFYTIIDDRLILSENTEELQRYIDDFISLQMLGQKSGFADFTAALSDQYNYMFYTPISGQADQLSMYLQPKAQSKINGENGWSSYTALCYQVSSSEGVLINNIYLPKESTSKSGAVEQKWQISLNAGISKPVHWVSTLDGKENLIVAQDDSNRLYLIGEESNIRWKTMVNGSLKSEIYTVDYYKNGSTQLLFNTDRYLYLIDMEGEMIPNFPIRLSAAASAGLSLFDYDKNRNYRIFISCDNGSVYGYDISGRPLDGWNPKKLGILYEPIQYVRIKGKDFLFAHNSESVFYFLNRRGDLIAQFKDSADIRYHNNFYFDESPDYGMNRFISTDQNGKIKSIFIDGRRLYKSVGNWSENHFFAYADITSDSSKEYVFIDNNQLMVYSDDTTLGYNYHFNSLISSPVFTIPYKKSGHILGVISAENNQFYVFDRQGQLISGFPATGSTKPSFRLKSDKIHIVTGSSDGRLYYYILSI